MKLQVFSMFCLRTGCFYEARREAEKKRIAAARASAAETQETGSQVPSPRSPATRLSVGAVLPSCVDGSIQERSEDLKHQALILTSPGSL